MRIYPKGDLERRFWKLMNIRGEAECWLWKGQLGKEHEYGFMTIGGRSIGAHRVAFDFEYGPIPRGLFVVHSCDVPRCTNPAHLSLGTAKDNVADMMNRGRRRTGRRRPVRKSRLEVLEERSKSESKRKLTYAGATKARYLLALGVPRKHVSELCGVDTDVIKYLVERKTYARVGKRPKLAPFPKRGSLAELAEMRGRRRLSVEWARLGRDFGYSTGQVRRMLD